MGWFGNWGPPTATGAVSGSHGYVLRRQQEKKRMSWEEKGGNVVTVPPSILTDALVGCGTSAVHPERRSPGRSRSDGITRRITLICQCFCNQEATGFRSQPAFACQNLELPSWRCRGRLPAQTCGHHSPVTMGPAAAKSPERNGPSTARSGQSWWDLWRHNACVGQPQGLSCENN